MNYFKTSLKRLFRSSLSGIEDERKREYMDRLVVSNLKRGFVFAAILFFVHIMMVYVDLERKAEGYWLQNSAYEDMFYVHIAILLAMLLWFAIYFIFYPSIDKKINIWQRINAHFLPFFLITWGLANSLIGQGIHGSISVYILAVIGTSAVFFVRPSYMLFVILATHIVFLTTLSYFQSQREIIVSHLINGTVMIMIGWSLSRIIFISKIRDFVNLDTIDLQRNRIKTLLNNILPKSVALELEQDNYIKPILKKDTTIIFTDFVSFSRIAEISDSSEVLHTLESLFNRFDKIVKSHGIEKLKTIGDGYMFAGGLFHEDNQLKECVKTCFEIIECVKDMSETIFEETGFQWSIRIGIHVGPAITGIIGQWRFIYDVWGKTVNVASRMEANSEPNRINVTREVFDLLSDNPEYVFTNRGLLPIKNMDPVEMFFIDRRDP